MAWRLLIFGADRDKLSKDTLEANCESDIVVSNFEIRGKLFKAFMREGELE